MRSFLRAHSTLSPPKPIISPKFSKPTQFLHFINNNGTSKIKTNPIPTSAQTSSTHSSPLTSSSGNGPTPTPTTTQFQQQQQQQHQPLFVQSNPLEEAVEKGIYRWRFVTLLGVFGSLIGSVLCFIKGCSIVATSYIEQITRSGKVVIHLVEAVDLYLLGTVMLVFGMGLYELFVCDLDIAKSLSEQTRRHRSNFFGLFTLVERPKWLEIKSMNELKTKVGHVIVMLLLIGLFDKSKKAAIHSPADLLCFSASILFCSGGLFLLSKLNGSK